MIKIQRLIVVLLAILLAQVVAAQTPAPSATTDEFVVWGLSGLGEEVNDYMIGVFEERHPEIRVVVTDQGWDEALRANLENAILIGQPPDIVIGENYFRFFAAQGDLQMLDNIIQRHEDDLIPATYIAGAYDGHFYAVPMFTGIFGFERNCGVIEAAGLDCETPPVYWDELLAEVEQINAAGAGDYFGYTLQGPGGTAVGAAFRIAVYHSQLDSLPCADEACTVPDFNNPAALPVYELVRALAQYTPPGILQNTHEGEVYEALFRGVSGYQIAGSWHVDWARDAGCTDCRYSPVPYPREGHPANLTVGNVLFAAPANSRHPELAREWLELMLSEDVQTMIYPALRRLPATRSALTALRPEIDDATGVFIDELLFNEDINILPQWEAHPRETWAVYNQLLEGVLFTERPISAIMAEAQEDVDALGD